MIFLLTNDDGIHAQGLQTFIESIDEHDLVLTVAPKEHLSGCGHQVTSRIPIKVEKLPTSRINEVGRWVVNGTPADCIRLAINALGPENGLHIDWVLSGINAGGNLGVDIYTSGTVAASREAAIHGLPSIAMSHHINGKPINWKLAKIRAIHVIKEILKRKQMPGSFWNVNLPQTSHDQSRLDIVDCPADINPVDLRFFLNSDGTYTNKGIYQKRPRASDSDVSVCFEGKVSVSKLTL